MPVNVFATEVNVSATDANNFSATEARVSIRELPKVSLHDHLDGGLRPQTIVELAESTGVSLPYADAAALGRWFVEQANSGTLVEYLKTFDVTTAVMQTEDALFRVAREYVADLVTDGVVYGEVRWAPEQHGTRGVGLDAAVEAVQGGIDAGIADALESDVDIRVTQILSAMRHAGRATEIARLAVRHRDRGVVGFDIAGAEAGFPPVDHEEAFTYLAREYFPVTVHAGEAAGVDSIEGALFDARALRLGHGVRLAEDIETAREDTEGVHVTLGLVAQWVKDRQIALELSPSSNVQTGAIEPWGSDLTAHPFDVLYQLGFRVTVNTDNRLMSSTTLTRELSVLADIFGYDYDDFEIFQLNAAASAFLPLEDRVALADVISAGFAEA